MTSQEITSSGSASNLPIKGAEAAAAPADANPDSLEKAAPPTPPPSDELPFAKIAIIMSAVMSAMFLISLDRTIVGVAIPQITDEFDSIADVGWYGSAFMLCQAASQLLFGIIYKHQSTKYTFVSCVTLFELGSLICGAAPNSIALVLGRAIAGLGAGGVMSGGIQIMISIIPLEKRGAWTGAFGAVFGLGAAVGPLIGGALTSKATWRWCFYINLPIGGVALALIIFIVNLDADRRKKEGKKITLKQQILQLDPVGSTLMFGWVISLVLALQFGGFQYTWSNGRVVALLIVFAITLLSFIAWQWYRGDEALLPLKYFKNRTFDAAIFWSLMNYGSMTTLTYYLPVWFQVIKGSDALHSGYQNLPFILGMVVSSIIFGVVSRKTGLVIPSLVVAVILCSVGAGLISTFNLSTGHAKWIGYQVMFGLGVGQGMMGPNLTLQAIFPAKDLPVIMASNFFFQLMGAAVWLAVAQNVFTQALIKDVRNVPGIDANTFGDIGATDIRTVFANDPVALAGAINAYDLALKNIWYLAVGLSASLVVPLAFMKWININKEGERRKKAQAEAAQGDGKADEAEEETMAERYAVVESGKIEPSRATAVRGNVTL